jgi:hypothetical protein
VYTCIGSVLNEILSTLLDTWQNLMKKSLRSDPIKRENKVDCTMSRMRDNSTRSNAKPSLKSENEEETARAVPLEEFNQ